MTTSYSVHSPNYEMCAILYTITCLWVVSPQAGSLVEASLTDTRGSQVVDCSP